MSLDFAHEKSMRRRGLRNVVYVDEVGVGPFAGPVTVCAVLCKRLFPSMLGTLHLRDSKKLSAKRREELYALFAAMPDIVWAVSSVSPQIVDRVNVYEATRIAGKRALLALEKKLGAVAGFVVLDGRLNVALPRKQLSMPKADEQMASCAIASIMAKVTRDRAMLRYHKKYPQYRFDLHKGYGTKLHRDMILRYGPSPIHRRSFLS